MTTLIQGHSVIHSSPVVVAPNGITYRYRIVLKSDSGYACHVECREPNGASSEALLYDGSELRGANWAFRYYSRLPGLTD